MQIYYDAGCTNYIVNGSQYYGCGGFNDIAKLKDATDAALKALQWLGTSNITDPSAINTQNAYKNLLCNTSNFTSWSKVQNKANIMYNALKDGFQFDYFMCKDGTLGYTYSPCPSKRIAICDFGMTEDTLPHSACLAIDYNLTNAKKPWCYFTLTTLIIHELSHSALETSDDYDLNFYSERANNCEMADVNAQDNIIGRSLGFATAWEYLARAADVDLGLTV